MLPTHASTEPKSVGLTGTKACFNAGDAKMGMIAGTDQLLGTMTVISKPSVTWKLSF
jgi:hypothetical protein